MENSIIQMEQQLNELLPWNGISFTQLLENSMAGEIKLNLELILNEIKGSFQGEVQGLKYIFITILVMGIVAALFSNFSNIFESHQVADISFYMMYLLLITFLLKTFAVSVAIAYEAIEGIVTFMKILIPSYFITVGIATGATTAMTFYQLVLVVIYGVEGIMLSVLLPFIYAYVFLAVINGLMEEERLGMLLQLIKKGITGSLKATLIVITGLGILQSMITPVIDGLQTTFVKKTISVIPGIGNIADSVTEVLLGSALLIKNSVGIVLLLLLIGICVVPILKIFLIAFLMKASSALISIVCDKRITNCTDRVGEGGMLLARLVTTATTLFIIMIAMVIMMSTKRF